MKNHTIYKSLQEYFKNTPKEKIIEDWNDFQHLDDEGITINEFLENQKQIDEKRKIKVMLDYKKLRKEFKEVLSKIGEAKIDKWLNMDAERLEEHKQETVEQVAKRIALETFNETFSNYPRGGKISNETLTDALILFFRLGSEWQQEQNKNLYSEEEVLKIITECKSYLSFGDEFDEIEWFKKYKKK